EPDRVEGAVVDLERREQTGALHVDEVGPRADGERRGGGTAAAEDVDLVNPRAGRDVHRVHVGSGVGDRRPRAGDGAGGEGHRHIVLVLGVVQDGVGAAGRVVDEHAALDARHAVELAERDRVVAAAAVAGDLQAAGGGQHVDRIDARAERV